MATDSTRAYWLCPRGTGARAYLYPYDHRLTQYWRAVFVSGGGGAAPKVTASRKERSAAADWLDELISLHEGGHLDPGPQAPLTVGEAVEMFCARTTSDSGRPLSAATARAYRSQLLHLVSVCREGELPLAQWRPGHVQAALAREASQTTRAQWLRAMRAFARWLQNKAWMDSDPTAGLRQHTPRPAAGRWLSAEEQERLLAHCGPATWPRVALAIATGMRVGELAALRWDWVKQGLHTYCEIPAEEYSETGALRWRTKSHQARSVPLGVLALEALERAREQWPATEYVLHDSSMPLPHTSVWNRELKSAATAAVQAERDAGRPGVDHRLRGLIAAPSYHDLRRTAGQRWLEVGAALHEVSRLLGHSSVTVTETWYVEAPASRLIAVVQDADKARQHRPTNIFDKKSKA